MPRHRLAAVAAAIVAVAAAVSAPPSSTAPKAAVKHANAQRELKNEAALQYLGRKIKRFQKQTWYWQKLTSQSRTHGPKRALASASIERAQKLVRYWQFHATKAWLRARHVPHETQWLCIHSHEGSWQDSGYPYWGGLQMDRTFMATYGADVVRHYGGVLRYAPDSLHGGKMTLQAFGGEANYWGRLEQMWVAERARARRGFYPWPKTARMCGLI